MTRRKNTIEERLRRQADKDRRRPTDDEIRRELHGPVDPSDLVISSGRGVSTGTFPGHDAQDVDEIISDIKKCRVCGCTDDDCTNCVIRTGVPCHWVEDDLCSACVVSEETTAAVEALRRRDDEPALTITVASQHEKTELEAKIEAAGGADGNIAHAVLAMPEEMLAIMHHWLAMGQVPQMFVKITPDQRSVRIVALRLSPEVARRL